MKKHVIALQCLWYALTPILLICLPLAIYVKKTTLRLPEAQGKRTFTLGYNHTHSLRLVHFGESTVAGVGVDNIEQGLSYHLAKQLSRHKMNIECHIQGENGIRFSELNKKIKQYNSPIDVAIITMGVNDTTQFTSLKKWQQNIEFAIERLKQVGAEHIFFMQVPPMAAFPALPFPLNQLLGLRSLLLDKQLGLICSQKIGVHHLYSALDVNKHWMAEDGYHPNVLGYEKWAEKVTPQMLEHLRFMPY